MNTLFAWVSEAIYTVSDTVWGWPAAMPLLVVLLVGTGLITTLRLGWIQVRYFRHGLRVIRGEYDDPEHEGDLSHFQALTTALSATVGIGNIAGVATAIHYGGPGRAFLDVGDGRLRYGPQVHRVHVVNEDTRHPSRRLGGRRADVLDRARPRPEVETAGSRLCVFCRDLVLRFG